MVSVQALQEEMNGRLRPQLVDVRTASEFAGGHIPGAINIPMDQFQSRRPDLRLEDGVVLICKGDSRARIVAGWMSDRGAVRVLRGGTDAWRRDGLELVTSSKTRWSLERQVRLGAGLLIMTAAVVAVAGMRWGILLALFMGAGQAFAGATDICPLAIVLAKMPWNQARTSCAGPSCELRAPAGGADLSSGEQCS